MNNTSSFLSPKGDHMNFDQYEYHICSKCSHVNHPKLFESTTSQKLNFEIRIGLSKPATAIYAKTRQGELMKLTELT